MRLPVRRTQRDEKGRDYSMTPGWDVFDRWFDDAFTNPWQLMHTPRMLESRGGWMPKVDVSETNKAIVVKVNVPGVDPKNMNVAVEDNVLAVSGKTDEKREEKGETWYRSEREVGMFQRSLELPSGADTEKIEATCANGVVTITIPKKPEAQRKPVAIKIKEK